MASFLICSVSGNQLSVTKDIFRTCSSSDCPPKVLKPVPPDELTNLQNGLSNPARPLSPRARLRSATETRGTLESYLKPRVLVSSSLKLSIHSSHWEAPFPAEPCP